jgi:gliding motility-associated-like protein
VGPPILCTGESTALLASGGQTYLWNTGATTPRINVQPQASTVYTVWAYIDGCPSKPDSIVMMVDTALPSANFFVDPDSGILPFSASFINLSEHSTHWEWDFGDGSGSDDFSPAHEYRDTGHYKVLLTVSTANGCRDTAVQKVIVGADFTIYVPNAFTPNEDGLNDDWHVKWIGVKAFHVMLFDRWGMVIFESTDPDFQWDGILHGKACQEGIYTYVIEASGYLRAKLKRAGTVTLIR